MADAWEATGEVPSILPTVAVLLLPICHNLTCSSSHQGPISPSPSCALHMTAGLSSSLMHALSGCSPLLWDVSQPFSASGHPVVHASKVNLSLLHRDFALQLLAATRKPGNLHTQIHAQTRAYTHMDTHTHTHMLRHRYIQTRAHTQRYMHKHVPTHT